MHNFYKFFLWYPGMVQNYRRESLSQTFSILFFMYILILPYKIKIIFIFIYYLLVRIFLQRFQFILYDFSLFYIRQFFIFNDSFFYDMIMNNNYIFFYFIMMCVCF